MQIIGFVAMKKHRISKAKNQTYHFKKRCDERLGAQIDRKAIQKHIKEQKFSENFYFLDRQSNRVTRYRYKFQNTWYIIPYDKNTHKVKPYLKIITKILLWKPKQKLLNKVYQIIL